MREPTTEGENATGWLIELGDRWFKKFGRRGSVLTASSVRGACLFVPDHNTIAFRRVVYRLHALGRGFKVVELLATRTLNVNIKLGGLGLPYLWMSTDLWLAPPANGTSSNGEGSA